MVFLVWASFTVYTIARACLELYRLGPAISFVPGMTLGLVALVFAALALSMLARVAFWRINAWIHRRDSLFDQAESLKRQISIQDRSPESFLL